MTAARPSSGAISGVVLDAVTKRPVAGATVSLGDLDDRANTVPRMLTDARGRFVFRDLKPSAGYYLGARRFGYAATRWGWTAPGQSLATADIARLTVTDGQWINDIAIPLWRLGSIEGRVVDERGEPVVGAAVRVFTTRPISGQRQLVGGPIAATDDRGVYRLHDLDPDRYVVGVLSVQSTVLATTAEAPMTRALGELASGGIGGGGGTSVAAPTIDVDGRHRLALTSFATPPPPAAGTSRAYPATFHPAHMSIADATPIEIGYGDKRTGVDFQLQPVPTVRVSGRLEAPSGDVPRFLLRLMPAGSERLGFGSEAATTTVDRDGTFTFLNVPAGTYTLMAQASVMDFTTGGNFSTRLPDAPGFPAGGITVGSASGAPGLEYLARTGAPAKQSGRATVHVGDRDVTDLIVPLRPAVALHGRIVLAEGTKPVSRLLMSTEPVDGDPTLGFHNGATAADDASLRFTIEGLASGRYRLRNFNGLAVVSAMWDGRDLSVTGFDTSSGQDFDDVVVTLTDKHAQVSGAVTGRAGSIAAVIVFPVDRERWTNYGWEPDAIRTTRSGPSGAFTIERLPAGDYFAVAVDPLQINAWTDPRFLAAAAAQATRVTLDWGDEQTQDVPYREVVVK